MVTFEMLDWRPRENKLILRNKRFAVMSILDINRGKPITAINKTKTLKHPNEAIAILHVMYTSDISFMYGITNLIHKV